MAQFILPERNYSGGSLTHSPGAQLPAAATHIQITLTSSEWDAKVGQGSVFWGVEYSTDGTNWGLLVGTTVDFGYRPKGTLMPSIGFTTGGPGMTGQVRLFVQPTADIRLGASITTEAA